MRGVEGMAVLSVGVTPAYIATSIEMRGEDAVLRECRDVGDTVEIVDNSPKREPPVQDLSEQEQLKRKFDFYLMCN